MDFCLWGDTAAGASGAYEPGFTDSGLTIDHNHVSLHRADSASGVLTFRNTGTDGTITWDGTTFVLNSAVRATQVQVDDGSTYMDRDGSGNLTLTDAVTGTKTLAQLGSPTYKYIKAVTQSEGDLHLSDGTNWNTSKALIYLIRVVTSSTDWDLYVLQNDNGFATDDANIPMLRVADQVSGDANLLLNLPYEDEDASGEVHLYFLDNSGANTADIYVIGFGLI